MDWNLIITILMIICAVLTKVQMDKAEKEKDIVRVVYHGIWMIIITLAMFRS